MKALATLAALAMAVAGFGAAIAMGGGGHGPPPTTTTTGGGHTPVTVCHKPGTPAEHELTFDDDGYKAHLAHGDTLGPCPTTTETTPTETTPTTTTPTTTTPTTPTPTTPTVTQPPHVVTGAASVICSGGGYVLSGTVDGQPADSVTPATLPGGTKGTVNVTVTRGDTSVRTTVTVNGDCAPATPPTTTTTTTTATTPSTPGMTSSTTTTVTVPEPKPKPPATKPRRRRSPTRRRS